MRFVRFSIVLLFACTALAQTTEPWSGTYQYDGAGNIKSIGTNQYVYDGANRLRQGSAVTATQHDVQSYAYDAFGNLLRISTARVGNTVDSIAIGVDPGTNRANRSDLCVSGATCYLGSFDEAGNQITFGSTSYKFDADGMMAELSAPGTDRFYVYDADNQRIAIVVYGGANSQTWRYELRDPTMQVVREVDATKSGSTTTYAWKKDYVRPAGKLLGATSASAGGETIVNFHVDHLGTPRLVTGAGGRKLAVHTYWPFGREAEGGDVDDESMKFTGHERDVSGDGNDLDYMHARHYSNVAGRFLSIDPVLDGKRATSSPQMWNRYAYVMDNPMFHTDPDGRLIRLDGDEATRERIYQLILKMLRANDRQYVTYDKKTGILTVDPRAKGSYAGKRLYELSKVVDNKNHDVTIHVAVGATMQVKQTPGILSVVMIPKTKEESLVPDGGGAFVPPALSRSSEFEVHVDERGSYLLQNLAGDNAEAVYIMAHELVGHAWAVLFKGDHSERAAQEAEDSVAADVGMPILRFPEAKK